MIGAAAARDAARCILAEPGGAALGTGRLPASGESVAAVRVTLGNRLRRGPAITANAARLALFCPDITAASGSGQLVKLLVEGLAAPREILTPSSLVIAEGDLPL